MKVSQWLVVVSEERSCSHKGRIKDIVGAWTRGKVEREETDGECDIR